MNWKRIFTAALGVFFVQAIVAGVLQMSVIDRFFETPTFFRVEGDEKLVPYFASRVLFVFLFTYIFAKGYENRGWSEGLRFGLLIWLFYSIPMTIGFWAFIALPDALALSWILVGLLEYISGGLVLAFLYKGKISNEQNYD